MYFYRDFHNTLLYQTRERYNRKNKKIEYIEFIEYILQSTLNVPAVKSKKNLM